MDASPTLVESGSPVVQYPRSTLLALYASPLVPDTLHGMKPLSEWYGEYQDPPSSPPTRTREAPTNGAASRAHNNSSSSSNHTSNSGSNLSGGRPNPFANFGRFGVDGGLDAGDVAGFTATKSASSTNDKRSRDGVPHLQREGMPIGGRTGARRSDASIEGTSPTKSSAFGNDRLRTSTRAGGADERNGALGSSTSGRREDQKKDRRAPNEGGWRSVGGLTDRDRKTGRGNEQPRDLRDLRNDKRDRNDGLSSSARGQRQPAWMDSDGPQTSSGSAPSWMDAPISSENFELGGRALPPHDRERGAPSSSAVAGAPERGVDSIAAFKKQMKELERTRSGGGDVEESKQPSESVFASLVKGPAQQQSESQSSVLGSLRSGGDVSMGADEASALREGDRSSRFAKYFDGKPPAPATSPNTQPQQAPSVFEALLGGGVGGASKGGNTAESSSKDAESMARLMGMLQVSSARATSPVNSKSAAPIASPPALPSPANAPMPPHPQLNGDRSRQTSGSGSRFAFSQPPSNAAQSALASSQPHEHQHRAQLSSRSVSASLSGPAEQPPRSPPRQSNHQATHAFALTPLGSPSTEGRPSQPQHPSQQHHHHQSAHSRAGSAQPVSPPVSANFELPPSGPQSPGGMPPPPPQFFQMLSGMQSPPPQQQHMNGGVASRPLPPISNRLLPQQVPAQQHQQQQHPIPGGPHQMPHFQSPPPPPPHMGFGNSPMSPEIAAAHMRAMSNPSRSQPPPFNMPPPPFMYGGPPPPMGSMAPNMPPFPAHFRLPPPPGPFSGAGVPDLMALLNSGGGPRIGAASTPLPPRAPPMPQGQPQQQQQQQHSMRQFMSPPPMNHGQ
ncbi:hypothetical protein MVLG_03316 [Microbotryum lychnidis-dioicae p1A1 Lamole]|uniref:Uncharacterized protein n=1 Tax=Microbotryum lychnidis-dioicae (strain p1A1 Lamole / MvSl-1064) TaxID=683840 RepID=U5H7U6_USTV1|nr:hypothetical protein MVLG_03316 [Microbotryum lychnidis-dioicae p1A1 Lamole]|eukprot:KDE06410.1 hypothetical protein MVLG_03316 [Microbotryum lychnidis-dioicae p1A1 Lamole]